MKHETKYVGRYAPSPTGALHLGNVQTALLAWLHARLNHGQFLLRIEDLDTPRVVAGSADQIIADLEWLGLDWDGEVLYQSQRLAHYQEALKQLAKADLIYACYCSRKDIREAASAPHQNAGEYPQTCRHLSDQQQKDAAKLKQPALRLKTYPTSVTRDDFVVKRADGLFAYQLAVTVDDLHQQVTHVVRGADLADSRFNQLELGRLLRPDRVPIQYLHAPLVLDGQGERLSKRDGSDSLQTLRSKGLLAEQVIAEMGHGLGLLERRVEQINAYDLIKHLNVAQLENVFV